MKIHFLLAATLTIACISIQQTNAQSTYLFEIGTTDSVYSEVLNESRKIFIQLPQNFDPETKKKISSRLCHRC